jgi:hypothetical protein
VDIAAGLGEAAPEVAPDPASAIDRDPHDPPSRRSDQKG